jgi:hypothetical protein
MSRAPRKSPLTMRNVNAAHIQRTGTSPDDRDSVNTRSRFCATSGAA